MVKRAFKSREHGKNEIIKYVRNCVKRGIYPTYTEIINKFHIGMQSYFSSIKEIYILAGFSYEDVNKQKIIQKGKRISEKKRRFSIENGRKKIMEFIKQESSKGHFPGRHEIQERLGIHFHTYFKDIKEAYKQAGVDLKKVRYTPFISEEKERKLTKVAIMLLEKMDYKTIKINGKNGPDILVKDKNDEIIPVELKAYHRNVNIPISNIFRDRENEVEQLNRYIKQYKASYGILITTTDRIKIKIPKNIILINNKKLISLLSKYKLAQHIPTIEFIRNTYSHYDRSLHEMKMKRKIINYIKSKTSSGHYPSMREIQNKFGINVKTYFPGNMLEAYKSADIDLPCRYLSEKDVRDKIADFIKKKLNAGRYPSLEEIEKKFKIHIRTYFKNAKEMYEYANVPVPCKHMSREEAKKLILSHIKREISKGKSPTVHEINKKFHICLYTYFPKGLANFKYSELK